MSATGWAAALSNASLQSPYFFVLEKIDNTVAFGPVVVTAQGTIVFDSSGRVVLQGAINRNGAIQTFATSGSFTLAPSGELQLALTDLLFSVSGTVSFDLSAMAATNAASGTLLRHEIFLAVRQSSAPLLPAFLNGRYFLAQRTITASGGSPQLESSSGTVTFDGLGNLSVQLSLNRNGSVTAVSGPGSYRIFADGSVMLSLPGRSTPVNFGFTRDGGMGFGASVESSAIHDLFAITRATGETAENASLHGSYQIVASGASLSTGFSIAASLADYRGDGTVTYQSLQRPAPAPARGSVSVSPDGTLQFSGVPGSAATVRGGLGALSHSLVAAAVGDPTVFNFLVAIRTPTQAASAVNAASFSSSTALSPGALVSVFGRNLARQTAQAASLPLPTALAGVTVKIGGVEAPLLFVSPYQINVQVPFEVQPSESNVTVVLDGFESGPLAARVDSASPGMFTLTSDGAGTGVFLHGDFTLVSRTSPARPGEVVLIYATGLGAVLPAVASGAAAPGDPLAAATSTVAVQIGGLDAGTPLFAGLAPGFAGLYQINVPVPAISTAGDVPVTVTAAGIQSRTVTMPVAP